MNLRNSFVGMLLIVIVVGLSYVAYQELILPKRACDICGRELYPQIQAHVFLKNGSRIDACCPRCAFHFSIEKPAEVARMVVEDAVSGEQIEAQTAAYIEGSDAESCHPASDHSVREPGIQYDVRFDRCLPGLVAFKNESDAREFQGRSGGRLITFARAVENVRHK